MEEALHESILLAYHLVATPTIQLSNTVIKKQTQPVIYHAYTDASRPRKRHAKHAHTRYAACSQPHLKVRVLGSNAAEKTFALRAKLSLLGPQPICGTASCQHCLRSNTHTHTHTRRHEKYVFRKHLRMLDAHLNIIDVGCIHTQGPMDPYTHARTHTHGFPQQAYDTHTHTHTHTRTHTHTHTHTHL